MGLANLILKATAKWKKQRTAEIFATTAPRCAERRRCARAIVC